MLDDILNVDNSVMVADISTDEELVERFGPQTSAAATSALSDDDTDEAEEPEPPSYEQACEALQTMKRYVETRKNMNQELTMLYDFEKTIEIRRVQSMKQTSITDFVNV